MQKTREIEIPVEFMEDDWKSNKVVIKRMTFGEQMRVRDQATNIKIKGKEVDGSVNQEIAFVSTLTLSITKAPWKINDNAVIRDLDGALGNWLLKQLDGFNTIEEGKKNSSETVDSK